MSQERWDVVIRFLEGPLSYQEDKVCRGPVVRLGANPGPGGLKLEGYRGLDERQAVITAYDGGTVAVAPVGTNQVRVAPHENVDWADIQTLRGPVYLSPNEVFHLGPPNRGVTVMFIEARRLGVWEQQRLLSDASQLNSDLQPSRVEALDTRRGVPKWFIPAVVVLLMSIGVGIGGIYLSTLGRDPIDLGPVDEGSVYYARVDMTEVELDPALMDGLNQPFHDFVMKPNADQAKWRPLEKVDEWDPVFLDYVTRSVTVHAKAYAFWERLDTVVDDYEYVIKELRKEKLPEVFAAIPYQESRYTNDVTSPVCAKGYWQFMPETAYRADIAVRECTMEGTDVRFTPNSPVPVKNVLRKAAYVDRSGDSYRCRIKKCGVDERTRLEPSTRGALGLLGEAWRDPTLAKSGAAVQIAILSHNAGYDDERYDPKHRKRPTNLLPAYKKHVAKTNQGNHDPLFYGKNITCVGKEYEDIVGRGNTTCNGVVPNQSQHYAYSIVAQHILAVCYYARNYGDRDTFKPWSRNFDRGKGYCRALTIPSSQEIRARKGR
jgi:hypothetical protein